MKLYWKTKQCIRHDIVGLSAVISFALCEEVNILPLYMHGIKTDFSPYKILTQGKINLKLYCMAASSATTGPTEIFIESMQTNIFLAVDTEQNNLYLDACILQ